MLRPPPVEPASLEDVPDSPIGGQTVYRVWRAGSPVERPEPWWFSSRTGIDGGRLDLPAPLGTLYSSTSRAGALLEGLQALLTNLPAEELEVRRLAAISVPDAAPLAADLCDPSLVGQGVTAAVWAGAEREITQQWAAALRRDGWWALHAGIRHHPSGQLRAVAVFGTTGESTPALGGRWTFADSSIHDNPAVIDELADHGVNVRGPGELPLTEDIPT